MQTTTPSVLVADDQPDIVEALRLLLKSRGLHCRHGRLPGCGHGRTRARRFDTTSIDLNYTRDTTSGREGLDLLYRIRLLDATIPVGDRHDGLGQRRRAVEAMRRGARDFIEKPWDNARLLATIRTQVELARALRAGDSGWSRRTGCCAAKDFPN